MGSVCALRRSSGSMPVNTASKLSPRFDGGYSLMAGSDGACSTMVVSPSMPCDGSRHDERRCWVTAHSTRKGRHHSAQHPDFQLLPIHRIQGSSKLLAMQFFILRAFDLPSLVPDGLFVFVNTEACQDWQAREGHAEKKNPDSHRCRKGRPWTG